MNGVVQTLEYTVSGMSCAHCVKAVSDEVGGVDGVESVEVDLDTKAVLVRGENLDDTYRIAEILRNYRPLTFEEMLGPESEPGDAEDLAAFLADPEVLGDNGRPFRVPLTKAAVLELRTTGKTTITLPDNFSFTLSLVKIAASMKDDRSAETGPRDKSRRRSGWQP